MKYSGHPYNVKRHNIQNLTQNSANSTLLARSYKILILNYNKRKIDQTSP